jgi:hypothetical protein
MINFDKYQKEVQHLLSVMRKDFKSLSVEAFGNMGELLKDKEYFHHFQQARHNSFEKVFGYDMARYGDYIFMVKKTSKAVVYIEVEVA